MNIVEHDEKVDSASNDKIIDVKDKFQQFLTEDYKLDDENKNKIEEFSKSFYDILKILKNDARQKIEEQDKDIEFHEKSIRNLENIPQESKKELEQKEIELLNILKKESQLINKFHSLFVGIEDIISFIDNEDISSLPEKKNKLQCEIITIAKELGITNIIER